MLKQKILNREKLIGTHINFSDPSVGIIAGHAGFDYIWIDTEHNYISFESLLAQIISVKSTGTPVIVRVPQDDLTATKKVLEMGPDGIVFPMVRSAEEANRLLSYTLYPPYGNRGCGPQRAVRYGVDDEIAYFKSGAKDLCRFMQVECKTFVDEMEEIASNPYIDGFILGLADLSGSINEIGDFFGENDLSLAKKAIEIATKHNKIVGSATLATDEETLSMLRDMGIKMITCGADFNYIVNGAKNTFETLKKVLG